MDMTLRRLFIAGLAALSLAACERKQPEASKASPPAPSAAQAAPTQSAASSSSGANGERMVTLPDFTPLMKSQGPVVVNVITTSKAAAQASGGDPMSEFFRRFIPDLPPGGGGPGAPEQGPERVGLGSGFIISADGYILTNGHVVADSDDVTVRLSDAKREFKAKVVGVDRRTDVALIKVDAKDLPVAKLGNSSQVEPGQWVVAIGTPFGFDNTITAGIVSATRRALPDESFVPFIQTDVAVNPGNSGGPLINLRGEVVGINSMIYSRTGGYMGVSFAIPIEVALDVAKQLQATGKVTRGRLGIGIQGLTKELAQSFKLDQPVGAVITNVEKGSPADKAGLKVGDV
jgi:serine protease Do